MISNNELGRRTLVAPGGALDTLLCGTLEESNEITRRGVVDLDLQAIGLPQDITARGVGPEAIPRYAYRDDGLLLHGALNRYVTDYIETAYPTEVRPSCQHALHDGMRAVFCAFAAMQQS